MPVLRVEHAVSDFDAWKKLFDDDPVDRKGSGVQRYRVGRSVRDPAFVTIDLEFATTEEAEGLLEKLHTLWAGPGKAVMRDPRAQIIETVEDVTL
ncbi:hypothetical protein R4282_22395 [Rhodococcus oxybenzonivorans]|jgi:hypothetical protein|uniref:hypothetical protein n=1 Tax=Rhodococcus TaxID=1827 RepID=UPI00135CA41C|nr:MULTISPECIES: hypothetical protein [Rhodococcus]MDV7355746.1 hypothetical protein [Rhodococcus oxybenzonivorans]